MKNDGRSDERISDLSQIFNEMKKTAEANRKEYLT